MGYKLSHNKFFAVIRETEGHHWVDSQSIDLLPEEARKKGIALDAKMPQWAHDNPIVEVRQVKIELAVDITI